MYSGPAFLAPSAQLLATLLIQHERLQGVQSPGVLIIFWFPCMVCAIVPFRSKILSAVAKVRGKRGTCQVQPYLGDGLGAQGHRRVPSCPSPAPRTSPAVQSFLRCPLLAVSVLGSRPGSRGRGLVSHKGTRRDTAIVGRSPDTGGRSAATTGTATCRVCQGPVSVCVLDTCVRTRTGSLSYQEVLLSCSPLFFPSPSLLWSSS